jgi:hypothetical protein
MTKELTMKYLLTVVLLLLSFSSMAETTWHDVQQARENNSRVQANSHSMAEKINANLKLRDVESKYQFFQHHKRMTTPQGNGPTPQALQADREAAFIRDVQSRNR